MVYLDWCALYKFFVWKMSLQCLNLILLLLSTNKIWLWSYKTQKHQQVLHIFCIFCKIVEGNFFFGEYKISTCQVEFNPVVWNLNFFYFCLKRNFRNENWAPYVFTLGAFKDDRCFQCKNFCTYRIKDFIFFSLSSHAGGSRLL